MAADGVRSLWGSCWGCPVLDFAEANLACGWGNQPDITDSLWPFLTVNKQLNS